MATTIVVVVEVVVVDEEAKDKTEDTEGKQEPVPLRSMTSQIDTTMIGGGGL